MTDEKPPRKVGDIVKCGCDFGWSRSASGKCTDCLGTAHMVVLEVNEDGSTLVGRLEK